MTKKTQGVLIFSILYVLGAGAVLGAVWYHVQEKGTTLNETVKVIADKNAREQKYSELLKLVDETAEEREALMQYVLTEDQTISFLADIERIALEQGAELTTNSLSVGTGAGNFDSLNIVFGIAGSETVVNQMITIFETLPYHGEITKLSLGRSVSEEGLQRMSGTIQLTVSLSKYD